MKKRLAKKLAKQFFTKGLSNKYGKIEIVSHQTHTDGRPPVYKKIFIPNDKKLEEAIYDIAYKLGWDGCHWSDPLLLEIDTSDLDAWEEENFTLS